MITKLLHFMFRALHELLPNFPLHTPPCSCALSLLFLEQALLWLILWPLSEMSLFPFYFSYPFLKAQMYLPEKTSLMSPRFS